MKKKNFLTILLFGAMYLLTHLASAQTVYVTEKGKKFHKKNCSIVNEGKKGMQLADAQKAGYTACASCKPKAEATDPKKKK